jgi:hypothetical protein
MLPDNAQTMTWPGAFRPASPSFSILKHNHLSFAAPLARGIASAYKRNSPNWLVAYVYFLPDMHDAI